MPECRICSAENPSDASRCQICGAWLDVDAAAGGSPNQQARSSASGGGPAPTYPTEAQVVSLLKQNRKIEAIKVYRSATGVGLKEAKDAVEEIGARYGVAAIALSGGCGVVFVMLLALVLLCGGLAVAIYMLFARP